MIGSNPLPPTHRLPCSLPTDTRVPPGRRSTPPPATTASGTTSASVPLTLDVTDPASIQAVVEAAGDVTVLINNAGANPPSESLLKVTDADIRANMDTNLLRTRLRRPRLRTDPRRQ